MIETRRVLSDAGTALLDERRQLTPQERHVLEGLVAGEPQEMPQVNYILNNSFGMLGINSVVIVKRN